MEPMVWSYAYQVWGALCSTRAAIHGVVTIDEDGGSFVRAACRVFAGAGNCGERTSLRA